MKKIQEVPALSVNNISLSKDLLSYESSSYLTKDQGLNNNLHKMLDLFSQVCSSVS